jgi:hypothetical protein
VAEMSDISAWATAAPIMFACHLYRKNLLVIDNADGRIFCGTMRQDKDAKDLPVILINWQLNHRHFEPIVRVEANGRATLKFDSSDPLIVDLLDQYKVCPRNQHLKLS